MTKPKRMTQEDALSWAVDQINDLVNGAGEDYANRAEPVVEALSNMQDSLKRKRFAAAEKSSGKKTAMRP